MAVGDAGAQGFRKPCLRWRDKGSASSRLHELLDAVPRDARKEVRDDDWGLVSDVIRIQKQLLAVVIRRNEFSQTLGVIKSVDPASFTFAMSATEVHGEGFKQE